VKLSGEKTSKYVVRRVYQIEDSQIARDSGRPRKNIRKDLRINELDRNMIYMT